MASEFKGKTMFERNRELGGQLPKITVEVAFEFVSVGEIDTLNEKFQAEVIIESKWMLNEEDKNDVYETEEYNPNKHWNPKLFVENVLSVKENIVYEISEMYNNAYVTEIRTLSGLFWAKLILLHFPVDVQELGVVLTSKIGFDKLQLVSDNDKLSFISFEAIQNFKDQQKWELYRLVTTSDHATYEIKRRKSNVMNHTSQIALARKKYKPPKIVAKCYAARRPGFYLMNAFFLVFLITAITFCIFSINYFTPNFRLQSSFTILLTSVSFKWVVNRSLPAVSYLTSLDAYQICNIFFICLLTTWHGIVGDPDLLHPDTAYNTDKWMILVFSLIYLAIHVFWVIWFFYAYEKVRQIKREERHYFAEHKDHFLPYIESHDRRYSVFNSA